MRERWIQFGAAIFCTMGACAANSSTTSTTRATTRPASAASSQPVHLPPPVIERHEPVLPPPMVPVVQPTAPLAKPPVRPPPPPDAAATTQPGPIDEKVAYALGYSAGRRIHDRLQENGRTADDLMVLKGLIDGLGDRDPAYSRQDLQTSFAEFQAYSQQRRAEMLYADNPAFRKRADDNLKKSQAVLDQNAEMAGVTVQGDGVQVQILTAGNGHVVGNARSLTLLNLHVSLADGTLIQSGGSDSQSAVATSDLLPALTDVIRGLKVGTKCRIWLPAAKAYGLTGKPPRVGPNEAIEYDFELKNAE